MGQGVSFLDAIIISSYNQKQTEPPLMLQGKVKIWQSGLDRVSKAIVSEHNSNVNYLC